MRAFHYDYLSRAAPSLTKLAQFKNNDIHSPKCKRPECVKNDLTSNMEHVVFEYFFPSSILYFLKQAFHYQEISNKLDEKFYLFPFLTQKKLHYVSRTICSSYPN